MRILIILTIILLTAACHRQKSIEYEPIGECREVSIKAHPLNDTTAFGMARHIVAMDSLLVVYDDLQQDKIHIFDRRTGRHMGASLRIGQSYDEIISPSTFSCDEKSGLIAVYDLANGALKVCDPSSAMRDRNPGWHKISLPDYQHMPKDVYLTQDTDVIAIHSNPRITKSHDRQVLAIYDELPVLPDELESEWMFFLSQTMSAISPDGEKLVQGTTLGCIMEIFRIEGNDISPVTLKCFDRPVYSVARGQICTLPETVYGFADLQASNDFIYATIHGVANPTVFPNVIHVFDWKGNIVKKFVSDQQICCFNVDKSSGEIYAVVLGTDQEQHLVRFDMAEDNT